MFVRSFWRLLHVCRDVPGDPGGGAPPNTPGGTGDPWYKGKADDRMVGTWQNNFAQHLNDPAALAIAATTSYIEAQKLLGAPSSELVRLPSRPDDPNWSIVHKRLGKPDAATDYQLKTSDGKDFEAPFSDFVRNTAFALNLSKESAQKLALEIFKFTDGQNTETQAAYNEKIEAARTELKTNWGDNHAANMDLAKNGAKALGLDIDIVNSLEKTVGYAKTMEMLRGVGAKTSEGKLILQNKGAGDGNTPMSVDQAKARKQELYADNDFVTRFNKGDAAAMREMNALDVVIAGAARN